MARYQLISSLLLLAILVAQIAAEAPRRLRFNRQRHLFARQEVQPTPYPSAAELKPEQPALIYGPALSTDVDELPVEQEPALNSFQPDVVTEAVDNNVDAEQLDTEEELDTLEVNTAAAIARLRSSRQRLAKLQLVKAQSKRQRIARLEQLPVEASVPEVVPAVAPAAALPVPQFYYLGAQQPYVVSYNAAPQQLTW